MAIPLKVLIIEDSDSDAALDVRALEKAGYNITHEIVATAKELKAALHKQTFDLIISDHKLPQFDSLKALALLKESGLDIPFLVVSGTIGEETAVKIMKAGAHDYVMKSNLSRLGTAVERELRDVEERRKRKQAENALKESEEKYRDLVERASDGICSIQDGLVKYSNSQLIKIWGGVAEEIIGTPFTNFIHPDELSRVADRYNRRMSGEQLPSIYETALVRKDGSKVDVELNVGVIVYKEKQAELVIIRDITERKQAEEQLIIRNTLLNALINSPKDISIFSLDRKYGYTAFNENHRRGIRTVWNVDIKIGTNLLDCMTIPEAHAEAKQSIDRALTGISFAEEQYQTNMDIFYEFLWNPIRQNDGEVIGVTCFARDITDRKKAQETLRESDERYQALFNRSNDLIYLHDLEGNFIEANATALTLLGYKNDEISALNFASLLSQDQIPKVLKTLQEIKETGLQKKSNEYRLECKNGDYIYVDVQGSVVYHNGKPYAILGIGRDITERKQAEKNLRQSYEKLQETLESAVAAIAAIAETRDPYTAGHQVRVTMLACAIAAEIGLPAETIADIKVGGILHDIGKIYVPAEILSKPGKLSELEFSMIKNHPQVGYDIVKKIAFPPSIAYMILQHHERLDGSGYPQGLKGDSISINSRVLAVADVVEAMSSHRPYRPALGIDKALEEIAKNKGKLYDPDVVDACLRLFAEKGYKF